MKRYWILEIIASVLRVLAWVILAVCILAGIWAVWELGQEDTTAFSTLLGIVTYVLPAFVGGLILLALSYVIPVFIDIEYGIRRLVQSLKQEDKQKFS